MDAKRTLRQSLRERWARGPFRTPLEDHPRVALGAIAVIVLFALTAGAVGYSRLEIGRVSYEVEFAQAAGIRPGDAVTVAGVPVGAVDRQRLAGDRVIVTLGVDADVPLGARTGAAIKLTTLLGARYIELRPAGEGSLPGHRITLEQTEVPYDLQRALESATVTFEEIDTRQIGQSLTTLAGQLDGVPTVLPSMLATPLP